MTRNISGLAIIAAALLAAGALNSAAAAESGTIPCAGVWQLNEKLTMRTRSTAGPFVQFLEPWGKNGWMRMNTGELKSATSAEWHFELLNGRTYQVFGNDPSLGKARKLGERLVEATRVREGEEANTQYVFFSQDCKRVTFYKPEGEDRHAEGDSHFYNDMRVFDKILPPAGAPAQAVAPELFGGWMLNRAASKLTLAPKEAESVVIVPWEKAGWIWNRISGGPYQPEALQQRVKRVECGAARGATAVACKGPPSSMMLYWATWDARPFRAYGSQPGEVRLKRVNERKFELTASLGSAGPRTSSVDLSADGRKLTVLTKAPGAADDLRVYDRIDSESWPTVER